MEVCPEVPRAVHSQPAMYIDRPVFLETSGKSMLIWQMEGRLYEKGPEIGQGVQTGSVSVTCPAAGEKGPSPRREAVDG